MSGPAKRRKPLFLALIVMVAFTVPALARGASGADAAWAGLAADMDAPLGSIASLERGLAFWRRFQDDARRYHWLVRAHDSLNMETPAPDVLAIWNESYPLLRAELMTAPDSEAIRNARWFLRYTELIARHPDLTGADPRVLHEFASDLWDFALVAPPRLDGTIDRMVNRLFYRLGTRFDLKDVYVRAFRHHPRPSIGHQIAGQEQVLRLTRDPPELRMPALEGGIVDLADYRGKLVLVNVWSIHCSASLKALSAIQRVYDEYRASGFEVVGVALLADRAAEDSVASRTALKRAGATWRNGVLAGQADTDFRDRYGILGVPVTWLLDREGRLVRDDFANATLGPVELEKEVRRLLELPAQQQLRTPDGHLHCASRMAPFFCDRPTSCPPRSPLQGEPWAISRTDPK